MRALRTLTREASVTICRELGHSHQIITSEHGWDRSTAKKQTTFCANPMRQLADADARVQIERWKQQHEQEIRLDAVQRSSAITRGKVTEHIVPYLPGFDLDPKDIRFLGTPIDLIAFKGLSASVEEIEIVFIEVKTGGSVLSARERAVKKAVEQKRVSCRPSRSDPLRRLLEPRR